MPGRPQVVRGRHRPIASPLIDLAGPRTKQHLRATGGSRLASPETAWASWALTSGGARMSKPSLIVRMLIAGFDRLNRRTQWHRLPHMLGVFNLLAYRIQLRAENLHDTRTPGAKNRRAPVTM